MLAETKAKDELAVHFRQEYDDMEDEGFLQQRYSIYWGICELDAGVIWVEIRLSI